ncbi:hypothetical protein BX666DRAFT_1859177, partial [Dichotomocladium elegans]
QFIVGKDDALTTIWSTLSSDICDAKLIAVIDQPGIHVNDLAHSESFAAVKARVHYRDINAVSRTDFEYVSGPVDVAQLAKLIAEECEGTVMQVSQYEVGQDVSPIVAVLNLPAASAVALEENDAAVDRFMQSVEELAHDNYAVIYTSSSAKQSKRSLLERRDPAPVANAPIFAKYQLFTPGIFMALAVSFIVIAIATVGLSWLVNIQTPLRFEGKPKKN